MILVFPARITDVASSDCRQCQFLSQFLVPEPPPKILSSSRQRGKSRDPREIQKEQILLRCVNQLQHRSIRPGLAPSSRERWEGRAAKGENPFSIDGKYSAWHGPASTPINSPSCRNPISLHITKNRPAFSPASRSWQKRWVFSPEEPTRWRSNHQGKVALTLETKP